MSYGIQTYDPDGNVHVNVTDLGLLVIDVFTATGSGTKTYDDWLGYTLYYSTTVNSLSLGHKVTITANEVTYTALTLSSSWDEYFTDAPSSTITVFAR